MQSQLREAAALVRSVHKLIQAPEPELYDVVQDPGELVNLVDREPEIHADLQRRLEELTAGDSVAEAGSLDPEAIAKLRSLGYLTTSGPGPASSAGGSRIDPKSKMADWDHIQTGIFEFSRGDFEAAAWIFEEVLRTNSDVPLVYDYLGSSYMRLEQWSKDERVSRAALAKAI